MILLFLVGIAGAEPSCPVRIVQPPAREIGVAMGAGWLPRASLVRVRESSTCEPTEEAVTVLAVDPWYRTPGVDLVRKGSKGCLPKAVLIGLENHLLMAGTDSDAWGVGDVVGPVEPVETCDGSPLRMADGTLLADEVLGGMRPVTSEQIRIIDEVIIGWNKLFAPIDRTKIGVSDWGRVALPMTHEHTEQERAGIFEREGLDTPTRQEKAVDAVGPMRDGEAVYLHFLGSDAPRSDRWATVSTVDNLLAVVGGWYAHCRSTLVGVLPEARPQTCTVQVGDLGWYNDLRPDPLGHRDHYEGRCVDLRLFRTDGSRYEAWHNRPDDRPGRGSAYSRGLTQAFIAYALANASIATVHFNDPEVVRAVSGVTPARGHDDHIHMCFP